MTTGITFRGIEQLSATDVRGDPVDSPLGEWYESVRDIELDNLTDEDLSVACRQQLFPNHVVPAAIRRLECNPLAGEKYDGELIAALISVPRDYWSGHPQESERLRAILDSLGDELDPETLADIAKLSEVLP